MGPTDKRRGALMDKTHFISISPLPRLPPPTLSTLKLKKRADLTDEI